MQDRPVQTGIETEVKIRVRALEQTVAALRQVGFRVSAPRIFEVNVLYDTLDGRLRWAGTILRLRQAGGRSVVTLKGKHRPGPHKSREELETSVGSIESMHAIFDRLGYRPSFRYEKYRTEYRHPGDDAGVITVDETPIGNFLELEGPGEWIDSTAERLGFSPADYVLDSYGKLYLADCEHRGAQPGHMVFAS